jgi:hypothetical protein
MLGHNLPVWIRIVSFLDVRFYDYIVKELS